MARTESNRKFYIGRTYDLKEQKTTQQELFYDPDDLTTHAVVVGMTGSGKTGLCIDILEEAALKGIPALLVDPKGDIGNLLLHFPSLAPKDFQPWVDPDEARREHKTIEQLAAEKAALWKDGLAKWGILPGRIEQVCKAVDYAIYTPGSDAGLPISILASLKAPELEWESNRELLLEKISSTVTALLGLVGIEADPMRSREHILMANIFEHAWKDGNDLDIGELIHQVQTPPFEKLGVFEVEKFYPTKDRFELAMTLNNLLASPSFALWVEGAPLDIGALLWSPDGRPRQSVFYLAHLSDSERMFFVTLLLSAVETWVRAQTGSSSLRALLYFDEVLGYLPPVAKPPSKAPLMRLLKQARAFGFGVMLATQNPVDLDYKALSNAGTWFIGRLQTEQDKNRLLDGLEGVTASQTGLNRAKVDRLISDLGKRVFLLHNVHEKAPQIFQTRWAMAYLRGPITRNQIPDLNAMVGAEAAAPIAEHTEAALIQGTRGQKGETASAVRPTVPQGIEEYFLSNNYTISEALKSADRDTGNVNVIGLVYRPVLLAQATARILDRKISLDVEMPIAALVDKPDRRGMVRWEDHVNEPISIDALDRGPVSKASFDDLMAPLSDAKLIRGMEKDFIDYVYRNAELRLLSNTALELVAEPGTTTAGFRKQCSDAARNRRDAEVEKFKAKYEKRIKSLQSKLSREKLELKEDQTEHSARKMEEMATHAENLLGLFGGSRSRRRVSTSLRKRRMTEHAKADIDESHQAIESYGIELEELEADLTEKLEEIEEKWAGAATEIEEVVYKPYKKNIFIDQFGVAWFPTWQAEDGEERFELPGYKT